MLGRAVFTNLPPQINIELSKRCFQLKMPNRSPSTFFRKCSNERNHGWIFESVYVYVLTAELVAFRLRHRLNQSCIQWETECLHHLDLDWNCQDPNTPWIVRFGMHQQMLHCFRRPNQFRFRCLHRPKRFHCEEVLQMLHFLRRPNQFRFDCSHRPKRFHCEMLFQLNCLFFAFDCHNGCESETNIQFWTAVQSSELYTTDSLCRFWKKKQKIHFVWLNIYTNWCTIKNAHPDLHHFRKQLSWKMWPQFVEVNGSVEQSASLQTEQSSKQSQLSVNCCSISAIANFNRICLFVIEWFAVRWNCLASLLRNTFARQCTKHNDKWNKHFLTTYRLRVNSWSHLHRNRRLLFQLNLNQLE